MTLRRSFRPLRADLDKVLFAAVGEEIDGIPLSTISALTRLGLDPWQEAGSDFIAAPLLGVACLFRARRSRAGERNHPWRIYVRIGNSISGAEDRSVSAEHRITDRITGGSSVSPSEDRKQPRGTRGDHLPA
jgi:hypothetical protein